MQIFVKIVQEIQPIPLRKFGIGPIPILKVGIGSIPIPKNVRQYPKMAGIDNPARAPAVDLKTECCPYD